MKNGRKNKSVAFIILIIDSTNGMSLGVGLFICPANRNLFDIWPNPLQLIRHYNWTLFDDIFAIYIFTIL